MRLLTKLSIENLLHPFQTFILGQKNIGPKIASKYNIPLVFYGESKQSMEILFRNLLQKEIHLIGYRKILKNLFSWDTNRLFNE